MIYPSREAHCSGLAEPGIWGHAYEVNEGGSGFRPSIPFRGSGPTAPTAPLPPPPPRVPKIREYRRTLPVTVDCHRKRPRAAPAGLRAHSARFPISTHTPECKGLTLPLAHLARFNDSRSIIRRMSDAHCLANDRRRYAEILTTQIFRPEDHQRHEMTGFQRVMQLSRHCATLQRCNQQGTDRRALHIEQHSCSLALSRRDLAQPRTRMTVTVSLREAPDVVILATHRWPPGTYGPEPETHDAKQIMQSESTHVRTGCAKLRKKNARVRPTGNTTTIEGENCERRGRKAESIRGKEGEGSRYRTYRLCSH
ncbi:hypothetical protein ALC53_08499 [Atta colombica]|uniref:Uncharacterized protein n=1 Tax=Atta colombica TaxID=520822 RepID=A0A195B9E6_9HYME|nr:hypothetical protein ALC53_08499 [Atta colombica]